MTGNPGVSAAASKPWIGNHPPDWEVRPSSRGARSRCYVKYLPTLVSRCSKVDSSG